MNSSLSQEIQKAYDQLIQAIHSIPADKRCSKVIQKARGLISISNLIAYQIGWGKCLIRWYQAGIKGKLPEMPGEGFLKWDYAGLAEHFYQKYEYDASTHQLLVFQEIVMQIIAITKQEQESGNLNLLEIWPWCTLPSGKKWPLSKWIQVNTVSPYKRANQLIHNYFLLQ